MTTIPNGLQLLLGDYNFLFIQITLPNNQPVLQTDPTGIRKLDGSGNNILHPTWGSSDTPFTRFTFNAFQAGQRGNGANYNGFGASLGPISFNWGPSAAGLTYMNQLATASGKGVTFHNDLNYSKHYGGFVSTKIADSSPTAYTNESGWGYDTSNVVDYSKRGVTITDANPRLISNLISNQADKTLLDVQDDPFSTPDGRNNPLTGLSNPLPYSMYLASWGQYFDHGLDLVLKGVDGKVLVPILPGDDLYTGPGQSLGISRTNTYNVSIQKGSSDALMTAWGLSDNGVPSFTPVTSAQALSGPYSGGLLLNGVLINFSQNDAAGVVAAINAQAPFTGVNASLDSENKLILTPLSLESRNTISPPTDLSQEYGSAPSQLIFISEYVLVNGVPTKTGNLLNHSINGVVELGGGGFGTQSRWSDVKTNALLLGLTLHDYNVGDTPVVKTNADGSVWLDPSTHTGRFLAVDNTTGLQVEITDTALNQLAAASLDHPSGLTLLTTGHAFLNDRGPLSLASDLGPGNLTEAGDNPTDWATTVAPYFSTPAFNPSGALFQPLDQHLIAGDGRTNENIGLSSIQEIWHSEHNRNVEIIKQTFGLEKNLVNGLWDGTWNAFATAESRATFPGAPPADNWTGEMLQQAAKVVTESEYQHVIFQEFVRKFSPNVGTFQSYNINLDSSVSAEFASSVYRFGHSMLAETLDLKTDQGVTEKRSLLNAFLNPESYNGNTAADLARGLTNQVGNEIDEWVTDTLRNHLVGQKLDLATANIVRGRDSGVASWNDTRASLYQQASLVSLAPYQSWYEVGAHLLHGQDTLKEFIEAYAHDDILTRFYAQLVATGSVLGTDVPATNSLAAWADFQLTHPDTKGTVGSDGTYANLNGGTGGIPPVAGAYSKALSAAADLAIGDPTWMDVDGNQDFWTIDLWTGGLAEDKAQGSMLGTTMDCIFAVQMNNLQNGDRMYYINRLGAAQNILVSMDEMTLADLVMRNTGATHLYSDIFSVPDSVIEIKDYQDQLGAPLAGTTYNSVTALKTSGAKAGWVGSAAAGWTFTDNPGDYLDARGVKNPNGPGNASSMIGGTEFAEKINGLGGNETVWGDGGNDTIEGGAGNDFLHGGDGNEVITDLGGDDYLWGDGGDDKLNAGEGIDLVFGGAGNDTLYGGQGNDASVNGDDGNDLLFGGDGKVVNGVMDATDGGDVINGGRGDDTMYGGGGNDVIDGGEGNDLIYGGIDNNLVEGFNGDDIFIVDATQFGYQNAFSGGLGHDIVDYRASNGQILAGVKVGINVNLGNAGAGIVIPAGRNVKDVFLSIEEVMGSAFNDIITTGDAIQVDALGNPILGPGGLPLPVDSTVHGMAGNDSLSGGVGNDTLDGGNGNDTMAGLVGNDTYIVDSTGDVVVEAALAGSDTVISAVTYTLGTNIENLTLSTTANNNGTGNTVANLITGNTGNNLLSGLASNDTLLGGDGNDTLDGGTGTDSLLGGAGDDTYLVELISDSIVERPGEGTDTVLTSITYTLSANIENLTLTGVTVINGTGNDSNNVITGNTRNNILSGLAGDDTLNGGSGNDTLLGGSGNDSMSGLTGNDIYVVDSVGDIIVDTGGTDTIQSTITYTLGGTGVTAIENLTLSGASDLNGIGNASNNVIVGNDGNNVLVGLAGSDSLSGAAGNDSMDGGAGNDTLIGGAGADTLIGGLGGDRFLLSAFSDSQIGTMDVITDFVIGTDILDSPRAVIAANISKITTGTSFSAANLATALNGNFLANTASLLTFTDGTYLAMNDTNSGWNATNDAVLRFNFTGNAANLAIV